MPHKKNILPYLILVFLIGLIGITNPPIEIHNWRQAFTNTVARNFLEIDANIFYPRINTTGLRPDIIASEFPIFNYLIYFLSSVFGQEHWYGRLINWIFSCLGVWFFYKIIARVWNEKLAFCAGIILLSSLWFTYSRKVMPDTFSLSLMLGGLFFALKYLDRGKLTHLLLFVIFAGLGGLSKIPSTVLMSLLFFAFISSEFKFKRRFNLAASSALVIATIGTWYFVWNPHLEEVYQNRLYFPRGLVEGAKEILALLPQTLKQFYFYGLHSYIAFAFFILGLVGMIKYKKFLLSGVFLLGTLLFLMFISKTGDVFSLHTYYMLPYVPIMALMAAFGIVSFIPRKWAYLILAFVFIEGFANQQHELRLRTQDFHLVELEEKIINANIPADQKIATSGGLNPMLMYFAHRRGWSLSEKEISNPQYLQQIKKEGCQYLLIYMKDFQEQLDLKIIHKDDHYTLYKL